MKRGILFISAVVFTMITASAQHWMHDVYVSKDGQQITFQDMKDGFNHWAEGKNLKEIKGWRSFKRWEWFYEQRTYPNWQFNDPMAYYNELIAFQKMYPASQNKSKGTWTSLSPATLPTSPDTTSIHGMGRVNCVAFHPVDSNIFYLGASQGGVWKTTDGGNNWIPLTDQLPVMAVSDIALNPLNPDVIYLATGDIDYIGYNTIAAGRPVQFGMGLLKSIDGGVTWDTTGLSYLPSQGQNTLIRRVFVNPNDTLQIVAGGAHGLFYSSDGGITFTQTQIGVFADLKQNPLNPSTIFAMGYYQPGWGGTGARMYKTTDFGQTWTELTTTIPITGSVLRTELAIAPSDTNIIYALSCSYSGGFNSFHKSEDAGTTWQRIASRQSVDLAPNMLGWADGDYFQLSIPGYPKDTTGQGTYDLVLAVHPDNPDLIFAGGVNLWGSLNGGVGGDSSTWNIVSMWVKYFGESVHADQHYLAFHPITGELFVGGDGGLYKTDSIQIGNLDEVWSCINLFTQEIMLDCYYLPTQWTYLSHGVHNTEFYKLGLSRANPDMIIGGTQDNGTYLYKDGVWINTFGGDGMEAMLHHSNENIMYATNYNGALNKSTNGGISYTSGLEGPITGTGETGDWVTPFVMDPWNPEVIYAGFNNVWKSSNGGANWSKISTWGNSLNIRALTVAPSDAHYIYASRSNALYRTKNEGTDWTAISTGLPMSTAMLTYISVSFHNPEVAWVSFSGFQDGKKVYKTSDAGENWENISYNLPNVPVSCIVHQAGFNSNGDTLNGLYAGTDIGVFYTNDSLLATATPWILFNGGLPSVIVTELEIQYEAQKIVAATYGRGIWESPLYETTTIEGLGISDPKPYSPIFKVYPNPTDDKLYIDISKTVAGEIVIDVLNVEGKIVLSEQSNCSETFSGSINVQNLLPGNYFVHVKNGNTVFSASIAIL